MVQQQMQIDTFDEDDKLDISKDEGSAAVITIFLILFELRLKNHKHQMLRF
jgi:hypothetical protein